ncbi:hypothetical protein C9I56_00165 [Paraburkholderia caribensis]|nr:hypothetical protein C9I56_00165 [Paraburkholderia caribensis]QLB65576.1 hypothetical protein A9O66_24690 [Paraburkholderia caribensis]
MLWDDGAQFSLEVLCRTLIKATYWNTAQATRPMVEANARLLQDTMTINPRTLRQVKGVCLTEYGRERLAGIVSDFDLEVRIAVIEQSDFDIPDNRAKVPPTEDLPTEAEALSISPRDIPADLIKALVTDIETDPFRPIYRKVAIGAPVTGWRARLDHYFWPRPEVGYHATVRELAPLLTLAKELATTVGRWTTAQRAQAVSFADQVFAWGGVPQRAFDDKTVETVIVSAIQRKVLPGALMNSGWTKVAAFATAHLEPEGALVIWDSRVAHSLIRRIDRLLVAQNVQTVPDSLNAIGRVPGRGGSRTPPPKYVVEGWGNGYKSWASVFAGSALVRAIRDELNAREEIASAPGVLPQPWTLRQVEMVLFMDGY